MNNKEQPQKDRPGRGKAFGITLLALVDDFILIALLFVLLRVFNVELEIWALVVIGILGLILIFIAHRAILVSFQKRKVTGREGMIGETVVVVKRLQPKGMVRAGAEYWNAISEEGTMEEGEEAVITGIRGLSLEVKKKS